MNPTWTDLEHLRIRCHGDTERMKRYIMMFLQGTPSLFEALRSQLDLGDLEGLSRTAHGLKPQAEYMGAFRLREELQAVEQAAASGDRAASASALGACAKTHADVLRELENALAVL